MMFIFARLSVAGVLLKTGFEAAETPPYVTGPLVPQNGWFVQIGTPNATIQTTTVFAGTQALEMDATGLTGQNLVRHVLTDPLPGMVVFDVHFQQSASGTGSIWDVLSVFGNASFLGQIVVDGGGNASFNFGPSISMTKGAWHDFRMVVDFGAGTVASFADGTLLVTQTTGGSTSVSSIDLGINVLGTAGTDSGFDDDLSIISQAPSISKSFAPSTVAVNGGSALTITITNPSVTDTETNVGFTDTLPAGIALGAGAGFGGCGSPNAGASGNVISMSGATIALGGTCTFQVFVTGIIPGLWVNTTSSVTSDQGTGNSASATLIVVAPATISKAFASSQLELFFGSTALSFTIANPNATTALTNIAFTDTLPAGLTVLSPDNVLTGSCGGGTITAVPGFSSISLSGVTLAPGSSCTFSVNVSGSAIGVQTNTTSTVTAQPAGVVGGAASATTAVDDLFFMWFFN
jgi:uncharacterized repeat protein (TIGR01451 family)